MMETKNLIMLRIHDDNKYQVKKDLFIKLRVSDNQKEDLLELGKS